MPFVSHKFVLKCALVRGHLVVPVLLVSSCSSYGGQGARDGDPLGDEGASTSSGGASQATGSASAVGTGGVDLGASTGGRLAAGTGGDSYTWTPAPQGEADFPSDMTDLSVWRLELPIAEGDDVVRIEWDELRDFQSPPFFQVTSDNTAISFRAPVDGGTTSGSRYPRSELREMDGLNKAYWSVEDGLHIMEITQRITQIPKEKPHIVLGQIHDDDDDVIMIRFEEDDAEGLFVEARGTNEGYLDESYSVGDWFTVKIEASSGKVRIFYKRPGDEYGDPLEFDVECLSESLNPGKYCYFKAGAYTQSSLEEGDQAGAYGEVEISSLTVSHQ